MDDLLKSDPVVYLDALYKSRRLCEELAERAVMAFEATPYKVVFSEHLFMFGSIIVKPLSNLVAKTEDKDVTLWGSLLLLEFGQEVDTSMLMNAIATERDGAVIARILRRNSINVEYKVLERLRHPDVQSDVHLLIGFLQELKAIGTPLPNQIREQIQQKYPDLRDDFNQPYDYFLLNELLN
jgi:hypothetical protein